MYSTVGSKKHGANFLFSVNRSQVLIFHVLSENVDYEKLLQVLRNILSARNPRDVAKYGNRTDFPKGRRFSAVQKTWSTADVCRLIVFLSSFLRCF